MKTMISLLAIAVLAGPALQRQSSAQERVPAREREAAREGEAARGRGAAREARGGMAVPRQRVPRRASQCPAGGNTLLSPQVVMNLQGLLRREGYYRGRVDGLVGEQTRRALMAYQRARNLDPTGRIDLETFRVLDAALFRRQQPVRGTVPPEPVQQGTRTPQGATGEAGARQEEVAPRGGSPAPIQPLPPVTAPPQPPAVPPRPPTPPVSGEWEGPVEDEVGGVGEESPGGPGEEDPSGLGPD